MSSDDLWNAPGLPQKDLQEILGHARGSKQTDRYIPARVSGDWKRSGEVIAALIQKKHLSPGGLSRSFGNDVLLAVSCREAGMMLITENQQDFQRIREVEQFNLAPPWPSA